MNPDSEEEFPCWVTGEMTSIDLELNLQEIQIAYEAYKKQMWELINRVFDRYGF